MCCVNKRLSLDVHLAEVDVLFGPEVLVPVLCLLPQLPQLLLQVRLVLRDPVHDGTQIRQGVWRSNPVVRGAGRRPEAGTLR